MKKKKKLLYILVLVVSILQLVPSFSDTMDTMTPTTSIKQPKGENYTLNTDNIHLEDYGLIDPAPTTTDNITSGPIEHGTPLIPYIPKPTPPNNSTQNGLPPPPSPA